jgi:hypothetical protein
MLCRLKEITTILKEDNRLLKEHNSTAMGINEEGRIVGVNLQNVLPTDKV